MRVWSACGLVLGRIRQLELTKYCLQRDPGMCSPWLKVANLARKMEGAAPQYSPVAPHCVGPKVYWQFTLCWSMLQQSCKQAWYFDYAWSFWQIKHLPETKLQALSVFWCASTCNSVWCRTAMSIWPLKRFLNSILERKLSNLIYLKFQRAQCNISIILYSAL